MSTNSTPISETPPVIPRNYSPRPPLQQGPSSRSLSPMPSSTTAGNSRLSAVQFGKNKKDRRSTSADRFKYLKKKKHEGPTRATDFSLSDASSEEDDDRIETHNTNLPSFSKSNPNLSLKDSSLLSRRKERERLIENDAVNTIRDNSMNNGSDEDELDDDLLKREYEKKISGFNQPKRRKDDNSDTRNEQEEEEEEDDEVYMSTDDEGDEPTAQQAKNPFDDSIQEKQGADGDSIKKKNLLKFKSDPTIIPGESNNYDEEKEHDSSSMSSEDGKLDHFKQFFRRKSTVRRTSDDSHRAGLKNLQGDDDDDGEEGGFLSKFINLTGGGLVPAVNVSESPVNNSRDVEKVGGQQNLEDPIPMVDINSAAQQIVQAHAALANGQQPQSRSQLQPPPNHHTPANGQLDPSDLQDQAKEVASNITSDGETFVSSGHNSFYAPMVGHYDDIDNQEDFDPLMEDASYVAPPARVRGGVLGSLLKLYQNQDDQVSQSQISLAESSQSPSLAEAGKKNKLISFNTPSFGKKKSKSGTDLTELEVNSSNSSVSKLPNFKATRPKIKKIAKGANKFKRKANAEARITVHIADLLQRQRFILRMCKALMLYGAPTHRLEEYMVMTSRVLEIDGQFLYVPGCMTISFGDATTRTSEVQLVRCNQGLNLWKLHQVHSIYKQVVHDVLSVEDANLSIDKILQDKNLYPPWLCVLMYGFCASMVTPFAFGGDWINMAVSFFIGTCVGFMQFVVSQRSNLYSNVFEVTASIVVSFCGRALGSIRKSNICFGAVAQGSLALILPGYIILCGSLELQSRNLVAGSVRMFYAIIYSLFLGFGITLGAALFGWIYNGATNETKCEKSVPALYRLIFVPCFSIGLGLINQARWTQLPVMTVISCTGYVVTYWSGQHFANSTEFTSAMAAFVIGIMGNLYSRVWKGLAVSAMLPAIFVQVPSGVASQSSLLAGVQNANQIVNNTATSAQSDLSGSMSFGVTMIQVSIGISVGLFASTLFVYPFGKKRTGLFTL